MAGTDTRLARPGASEGARAGFRPDIEGLRAVAIGLVMLYHAELPLAASGFVGVDVFFVISGFLITGLLIKEVERTGRVSLRQFYARRAKRLLPAAAVVLVFSTVMTWLVLPVTQWREFGGDVVASALYFVNWRFAERSVDYLAEGVGTSPALHFWSLAVEEQFYIVWPLLLVLVALFVRYRRARIRPVMVAALSLVAIPTFLWSLRYTTTSPTAAFFVTTTRLWELSIGAAVAIGVVVWRRLPSPVAATLGWSGLLAIATSAFAFASVESWPGAAALLPTLGAAAVIVGGTANGAGGPSRLLGARPMVGMGALSYSLYLWHWPLLVFAAALWGPLGVRRALLVVLLSFLPAMLSLRLVENPIRFAPSVARSPRFALSLGANLSLVGVASGLLLVGAVGVSSAPGREAQGASEVLLASPAAAARLWQVEQVEWMTPDPVEATGDIPVAYRDGCQAGGDSDELVVCEYGDPGGELTVAIVGDSKVLQWQPAMDLIASERGWRLVTVTKSSCAFAESDGPGDSALERSCAAWNDRVLQMLLEHPPDLVLTSNVFKPAIAADPDLLARRWARLQEAGTTVVPLLDNPNPGFEVYECVAENLDRLSSCSFAREQAVRTSGAPGQLEAAASAGITTLVDMTDVICPGQRCPPVIGNVLVYRQGSHLTRTFVESAAEELARQFELAIVARDSR